MRPHAQYLMVYGETQSAARTALILGCSKSVVYRHLHRAGLSVRPYRRRHLYLVGDPLVEWGLRRQREIDAELREIRAAWSRALMQVARLKGRTT